MVAWRHLYLVLMYLMWMMISSFDVWSCQYNVSFNVIPIYQSKCVCIEWMWKRCCCCFMSAEAEAWIVHSLYLYFSPPWARKYDYKIIHRNNEYCCQCRLIMWKYGFFKCTSSNGLLKFKENKNEPFTNNFL